MIRCNICNAQLHDREPVEFMVHLFTDQQGRVGFSDKCLSLNLYDEGWRPTPEITVEDLIMDEV